MNKWGMLILLLFSFNLMATENMEKWHRFLNTEKNTNYKVYSLEQLQELVPENGKRADHKKGVIDITKKLFTFNNDTLPKGNIGINRAGYVIIQSHDFTSLNFLNSLDYVYYLALSYLPELTSLEGLENLKEIGNLNIRNMAKLEDLNSLSNLETVYETLIINDVDLRNLNFLSNVKKLGDKEKGIRGKIEILTTPNIEDLSGIENISNIMAGSSIELPHIKKHKIKVFLDENSPLCREIKKQYFYINIGGRHGDQYCKPKLKEVKR